jgi:hypothetical protein
MFFLVAGSLNAIAILSLATKVAINALYASVNVSTAFLALGTFFFLSGSNGGNLIDSLNLVNSAVNAAILLFDASILACFLLSKAVFISCTFNAALAPSDPNSFKLFTMPELRA